MVLPRVLNRLNYRQGHAFDAKGGRLMTMKMIPFCEETEQTQQTGTSNTSE